jgi:hypothetical protein
MRIGGIAGRNVMTAVAEGHGIAPGRYVETGGATAVAAGGVGARPSRNVGTGIAGGVGVGSMCNVVAADAVGLRQWTYC